MLSLEQSHVLFHRLHRLMFETQNMGYIIDEGNGHGHGAKRNWLRVNV